MKNNSNFPPEPAQIEKEEVPILSQEQLNEIISELSYFGGDCDKYCYGLPGGAVEMEEMRQIILRVMSAHSFEIAYNILLTCYGKLSSSSSLESLIKNVPGDEKPSIINLITLCCKISDKFREELEEDEPETDFDLPW